ncbi:stalk domain-containing protein [Scopulibacillus cellulosilyticus]|uniref:Stalk domain-containing protein n=1 Tax=Scopulibacillus cellulosilyticus TaxID=2665665 RepID=A0ABW2PWN9_9BACL
MKKKLTISLILSVVLCLTFSAGVFAATKYKLIVDGKEKKTEVRMINNTAYVPLKQFASDLGAKVSYDSKHKTYNVTSKDYKPPVKTTKKVYSVKVNGQSGPMKIKISKVTLDPAYKYDKYSSAIRAVVMDVQVENTSKKTISWYPDQGIMALNTKEQVDNAILYSDELGGDYHGQVVKKGRIVFKVKSDLNSIKNFRYYIDGAMDKKTLDSVGKDITLNVTLRK